jgi:hypothetical protein
VIKFLVLFPLILCSHPVYTQTDFEIYNAYEIDSKLIFILVETRDVGLHDLVAKVKLIVTDLDGNKLCEIEIDNYIAPFAPEYFISSVYFGTNISGSFVLYDSEQNKFLKSDLNLFGRMMMLDGNIYIEHGHPLNKGYIIDPGNLEIISEYPLNSDEYNFFENPKSTWPGSEDQHDSRHNIREMSFNHSDEEIDYFEMLIGLELIKNFRNPGLNYAIDKPNF